MKAGNGRRRMVDGAKPAGRYFAIVYLLFSILAVAATGCRRDMFIQPKSNPLANSDFFSDGADSRPIPPHTVSRGDLETDRAFETGMVGTNLVTTFPIKITRDVLDRGRQRYDIYCLPCHGVTGQGDGIVVKRGFPAPPSYDLARLREAPIGHFVDVMTRGYGLMYPYAARVTPQDRWAIAAYIRVLQLSGHARLADVPSNEVVQLQKTP